MNVALIVAALAQALPADRDQAAIRAELEQVCKTTLCRTPVPIRLKLTGGKKFEMTFPAPMPIVSNDYVTVEAGEKVFVEARVEKERLVDLVAVKKVTHPERTLLLELTQEPSIGDATSMVLKIESPFAGVVKYELGMMLVSDNGFRATSCCPLHAKKPVFESWPHPIFQLTAGDFRLVDPKSKEASLCK